MEKNQQLVINHIVAMPSSIENYRYYINGNITNTHYITADNLATIINSFFTESSKLTICENLVKNRRSFEIDVTNKKIYAIKSNKELERDKLRMKNLKEFYTMEEWSKEAARREFQITDKNKEELF